MAKRMYSETASATGQKKFPVGKSLAVSGLTMLGLWFYFRHEASKAQQAREAASGAVGPPRIGGPFNLIDHYGKPLAWPADMNGAHSLLYFGFTHCPDICPEELDKIGEALKLVEASRSGSERDLRTLFVTCDPERDDPKTVSAYLKDFHPSIIGVTGPMEAVKAAARLFRVYFKAARTSSDADYLVDHTIFYYLMDPEGKYVTHFGREHKPREVADAILEVLRKHDKQADK